VRNHLVDKERGTGLGVGIRRHAAHHVAIRSVNARGKPGQSWVALLVYAANEEIGTEWVREFILSQTKGATPLVKLGRLVVSLAQRRAIELVQQLAILGELDASAHELVAAIEY
jgi:hypothetical protein